MITSLAIEGFKSFGPEVRLALAPLSFLAGANASGKTNLIQALQFLNLAMTNGLDRAVDHFGGCSEVKNKIQREAKTPKPVRICISGKLENDFTGKNEKEYRSGTFTYELKTNLRTLSGEPEVIGEHLIVGLLNLTTGQPEQYRLHRIKTRLEISDPSDPNFARGTTFEVPPQEAARLAVAQPFYTLPAVLFRDYVMRWSFFSVNADRAREPATTGGGQHLGFSGENLAAVLHQIERTEGKRGLEALAEGLKGVVPEFEGIKIVSLPIDAKWAFQIVENRIRGGLNPRSVSDGTVRLLALVVIAWWVSKKSSLIAIEEPENGLHPHLSEQVVKMFRKFSDDRQFLLTTHNPAFLDFANPDEVFFCDKVEGFTQIRRAADNPDLEKFKQHFSLGELWQQDVLGGTPTWMDGGGS